MRKLLIIALALGTLALVGCGAPEPEGKVGDDASTTTAQPETTGTTGDSKSTSNAPSGDGSGIAIHGSGAGGMAPVTGTENLQGSGGGGGGIGQAAKQSAKNAAANSGSTAGQMGTEGE